MTIVDDPVVIAELRCAMGIMRLVHTRAPRPGSTQPSGYLYEIQVQNSVHGEIRCNTLLSGHRLFDAIRDAWQLGRRIDWLFTEGVEA